MSATRTARRRRQLIEVRDLVKHFPITHGHRLPQQVGAVQAVDGVSLRRRSRGETLGIVGESGCGKSTTGAAAHCACSSRRAARSTSRASDIAHLSRKELKPLRRDMQMIFQDPYSSLNPRKTVGSIIGEPFVIHERRARRAGKRKKRVQELMEHGRAQPRALQPLPARVLRRPAPAHRRRARDRAEAEADRRRRAGLRARRLDPGADHQPARGPPARARPDDRLHRPRPLRRAPRVRPHRGHVPRQDRRARRRGRRSSSTRATRTPARCSARCRCPTRALATGKQRQVLGGDVPSPTNPPPACRFHTRCPKAQDGVCDVEEPLLEAKDGGNLAACHFPLTDEEIAGGVPTAAGVSAVDRVAAALARAGVDAEIREYPEGARTAQDAAAAVGCEVGQIVQVARLPRAATTPLLVIASGANRVDAGRASAPCEGRRRVRARADRLRDRRRAAVRPRAARSTRSSTRTCWRYDVVWARGRHAARGLPDRAAARSSSVSGGRVVACAPGLTACAVSPRRRSSVVLVVVGRRATRARPRCRGGRRASRRACRRGRRRGRAA